MADAVSYPMKPGKPMHAEFGWPSLVKIANTFPEAFVENSVGSTFGS